MISLGFLGLQARIKLTNSDSLKIHRPSRAEEEVQ